MPHPIDLPAPPDPSVLRVVCLCAAWCRTCESYARSFADLAALWGDTVQALWLDIEDHEDWLDGLEVETFPTLLMARDETVLFYGPVLPHPGAAAQLVARAGQDRWPAVQNAGARALARRLHEAYLADVGANTAAAGAAPAAGRLSTLRQAITSTATPEGA